MSLEKPSRELECRSVREREVEGDRGAGGDRLKQRELHLGQIIESVVADPPEAGQKPGGGRPGNHTRGQIVRRPDVERPAGFTRGRIEREQRLELGDFLTLKQALSDAAQRDHRLNGRLLEVPHRRP